MPVSEKVLGIRMKEKKLKKWIKDRRETALHLIKHHIKYMQRDIKRKKWLEAASNTEAVYSWLVTLDELANVEKLLKKEED